MTTPQQPTEQPSSYERIEYTAASFPRVNPSRMGAIGHLFGMRPLPASKCRMLELGCGQGATLLAMAQLYPESDFVGFDLSARHIENASRVAARAGLSNVRFEQRNILDVSQERDGSFDYIGCHGVYSWVPAPVKDKILAICGSQLNPEGIAYVSYNTLPGWAHLRVIREMLIYHTQRYDDPAEKFAQSRTLINFLRETAPGGKDGWTAKWLSHVESLLARSEPAYFLHEYLEETNDPCFFHQFAEHASKHALQYLAEAHLSRIFPANLGPQASKVIEMLKRSVIDAEQYMDFARNTQFRSTLLVRADASIDRNYQPVRLTQLLFATGLAPATPGPMNLAPDQVEEYRSPANGAQFTSREPLAKAAVHYLMARPGEYVSIPAIREGAQQLLDQAGVTLTPQAAAGAMSMLHNLVARFMTVGIAELSTTETGAFQPQRTLPERPFTVPVTRIQAEEDLPMLRHTLLSQKLTDEARTILSHCDGTRTLDELFAIYETAIKSGKLMKPVPLSTGATPDLRLAFDDLMRQILANSLLWQPVPEAQS